MGENMIKITYNTLTAKEWAYLRASVSWSIHSEKDFLIAIKNSVLTISVYYDNKLVGMARIMGDNKLSFFIQDVIVLPDFQNMGIGTLIVNSLLNYIYSHAAPHAVVNLMASKGKESFYEKFGFTKRNGIQKGFGMELIINPN